MDAQQLNAFILPIGFIVIFYIFAIRPQKKKEKEVNEMRNNLKEGDEIITIGGIVGKIMRVKEDIVIIEVGNTKTRLDVTKWSIASVTNKGNTMASKKEKLDTVEDDDKEI
ncbi:MAG: preprotein translocase subunit YajC [Tissierellia bacterium]|nr:preprotein translocase subunit YajC [Tissierellia bacterium]